MRLLRRNAMLMLSMLAVAACGGSPQDGVQAAAPDPLMPADAVSMPEAFQFLNQASFGATESAAQSVMSMGYGPWIDRQMRVPASRHLPLLQSMVGSEQPFELHDERVDVWFRIAINGEDQLRQRVAFALSEIFVVSQVGALVRYPFALASYYDMLLDNAFGNYRELIEDVTLHPAMGIYLSMLGNEKPDVSRNIRPDENYARELMQLFSIGLVELDLDGNVILDAQGQPVPTYDQAVIEGFAHVFTGWNFSGGPGFRQARPTFVNQTAPMQLYGDFHDDGEKRLLNGVTIPAGQGGARDLAQALDNVFNHPNVGPFIATRLIQRLVTSNPSPGYIERVARVFNDNGAGERGDLAAVVRAILMDPDARSALPNEIDGKMKEPLLRLTQLWRAYDASSGSGRYSALQTDFIFGQGPLQAPSVFNFFTPFYAPPGEIRNSSLVAPEFQIADEYRNTLTSNFFLYQALRLTSAATDLGPDDVYLRIDEELTLAGDPEQLVARVADKLLAGRISELLREETRGIVQRIPAEAAALRAGEAIYFIVSSPEFAYQR